MDQFQNDLKRAFDAHNAGRYQEAEAICRSLTESGREDAQLFFLLGMALHSLGRDIEAVTWGKRAIQLNPASGRFYNGMGVVWQKLNEPAKAAGYFAKAAELEPNKSNHFYGLGHALYRMDDLERAAAAFERAVQVNPQDSESWNNLGKCLKELNRVEDSIVAYDHALAINPEFLIARQGRAISLMTAGRLIEGCRDYESRWMTLKPRDLPQPRWDGEMIPGKTLFLHAEQGFGDGIQSSRYARLTKPRCGRVILECRPELKRLFAYSGVADEVIAYGEALPPFDYYTSVISLPGTLGFTLDTIPGEVPYLKAPRMAEPLRAAEGTLKVGIVWAGSPTHSDDANRSMPLSLFADLLVVPGVTFFSVQMPIPKRDAEVFEQLPSVTKLGPFPDYLATASAVQELDLVITVDTSVAHLAGAFGRPVWTMVQFAPDWRWFVQFGEKTPWYPTMRLFRQPRRGDWASVVRTVTEELARLVGKK